jgi:hypothetical protein
LELEPISREVTEQIRLALAILTVSDEEQEF